MSYNPNGGSSEIATSSDVALSNLAGGQVLSYNAGIGKWTNAVEGSIISASQQTTAYTLALADAGTIIELNSGATVIVTVPVSTSVAFPVGSVIEICQYGLGQVSVQAASGVQLLSPASLNTRVQYSSIALRMRAVDEWLISGDLAP